MVLKPLRIDLKSLFWLLFSGLFTGIILILAYCVVIIAQIPIDLDKEIVPRQTRRVTITLDPNLDVSKRLLKTYFLWSEEEKPFEHWLREKRASNIIGGETKKSYELLDTLELVGPYKNDCEKVFCYSRKMNFSQIPGLVWKGLIGIEDYRYLDHPGIDLRSLLRAFWHDIKVMRLEQGGSTLTQQLVKNLYLSSERKFSRKIKEMIVSIYLELKYSKEQILSAYFNEVEWGSLQGIRIKGIYAASLMYFDKRPDQLTPFEVSILIGLLKGPYYYSPIRHPDRLKKRASIVYNKLKSLNLFPQDVQSWTEKEWALWLDALKQRNDRYDIHSAWRLSLTDKGFDYFVMANNQIELIQDLKKKYPKADWAAKTAYWTLDNESYLQEKISLYSKVERSSESSFSQEKHQVGSLLKPIIYGILVEQGLNLDDQVETARVNLKLKSGRWSPREAHKMTSDKTTYRQALLTSMNNPIVRAVQEFGFDKMEESLLQLIPDLLVPLKEYPAQLLGSLELSINDLIGVYGKFFSRACAEGEYNDVVEALSDPKNTTIRFRVGENLGQMKFFGKTGTTNKGLSNWFVGFDGKNLVVSWVGIEDAKTAPSNLRVFGSNTAFLLYKGFFEKRGRHFNEMACQHQ